MPRLADTIQDLLTRAEQGEKAPSAPLQRGLQVAARITPQGRQLVLHRQDGKVPSRLEARTCARHAGWIFSSVAELTTPKGNVCLAVTETTKLHPLLDVPQVLVLRQVDRRQPLNRDDHAAVLALIALGLMHVTPEYDHHDRCPYRLTETGEQVIREATAA